MADSGAITVNGTINASGVTGGAISLYAYNGVTLTGGANQFTIATAGAQSVVSLGAGGTLALPADDAGLPNGDSLVATASGFVTAANGVQTAFAAGSVLTGLAAGSTITFNAAGTLTATAAEVLFPPNVSELISQFMAISWTMPARVARSTSRAARPSLSRVP